MKLRSLGQVILTSARYWNSDNVSTTGAALAFYCAFSLAPLIVILLSLAGMILGKESAQIQLAAQLSALFGPSTSEILLQAARSSTTTHGLVATVASIVTLLFGATTVLSALQTALDQIWESGSLVRPGIWGWIRARFLSLGFILALGFLLIVSLTVSTAMSQAEKRLSSNSGSWVPFFTVFDFALSLLLIALLFALIFRYMPARALKWRWALLGGLFTAAFFELGRWLVGLYLAHSTQPSAYGAASSFAALLLWLYYTAQIFLFGAEFTAVLADLRGCREPKTAASSNAPKEPQGAKKTSRSARVRSKHPSSH